MTLFQNTVLNKYLAWIDGMVYELYGLSEEEVKVVEGDVG